MYFVFQKLMTELGVCSGDTIYKIKRTRIQKKLNYELVGSSGNDKNL